MPDNYPRPRWGPLYLVLPLAGVLFWLIQRMHPTGAARDVMMVGALFILGGYVEAWRVANTVALLHHPFTDKQGAPIYYVREGMGSGATQAEPGLHALFVTDAYHDLFSMPVCIGEPLPPSVAELPGLEATEQMLAPTTTLGQKHIGYEADV